MRLIVGGAGPVQQPHLAQDFLITLLRQRKLPGASGHSRRPSENSFLSPVRRNSSTFSISAHGGQDGRIVSDGIQELLRLEHGS